jgi:hypothetical protein
MTEADKEKPGKPSAAPDEKEKVKKPVVPKLRLRKPTNTTFD